MKDRAPWFCSGSSMFRYCPRTMSRLVSSELTGMPDERAKSSATVTIVSAEPNSAQKSSFIVWWEVVPKIGDFKIKAA